MQLVNAAWHSRVVRGQVIAMDTSTSVGIYYLLDSSVPFELLCLKLRSSFRFCLLMCITIEHPSHMITIPEFLESITRGLCDRFTV